MKLGSSDSAIPRSKKCATPGCNCNVRKNLYCLMCMKDAVRLVKCNTPECQTFTRAGVCSKCRIRKSIRKHNPELADNIEPPATLDDDLKAVMERHGIESAVVEKSLKVFNSLLT